MRLFSRSLLLIGSTVFVVVYVASGSLPAQVERGSRKSVKPPLAANSTGIRDRQTAQRTASIHWQDLPLRDAISRLKDLFSETVFVDRRIDPGLRVNLDIEATSAEEVIRAIAADRELGVGRLGAIVYLGPIAEAEQLRGLAAARATEVARLPADLRSALTSKQSRSWPRLSEPRRLVSSVVEQRGWRLANADKIPHDLWAAGELPELTLVDSLTVLLIGFDLTFELRANDRLISIVPLKHIANSPPAHAASTPSVKPPSGARPKQGGRQVYTLRVREQPVRKVLQQLSKSLHWPIEIDEASILAAGKSLDVRVSFSVENVDRERLLEALLSPAELDYRIEGDRVRIIARRYGER